MHAECSPAHVTFPAFLSLRHLKMGTFSDTTEITVRIGFLLTASQGDNTFDSVCAFVCGLA